MNPTLIDRAATIEHSRLFIRAEKQRDRASLIAEAQLHEALTELFAPTLHAILNDLTRVPANAAERAALLRPLEALREPMAETLGAHIAPAWLRGKQRIIDSLPAKAVIPVEFDEIDEQLRDRLANTTLEASDRTMSRVVNGVKANLAKSYEQGLGIKDAAEELERAFDGLETWELRRVARTEIQSTQNEGAFQTELDLGVQFHQWLTALDGRERDSHSAQHRMVVKVGGRFPNGLKYPGDRSGPAEEFINCRCRQVPYITDRPPTTDGPFIPQAA